MKKNNNSRSTPRRAWILLASTVAVVAAGVLAVLAVNGVVAPRPATPPTASSPPCSAHSSTNACIPNTIELNGQRLLEARIALRAGDPTLVAELSVLLKQANAALVTGPWTVTATNTVPPSGDVHDYLSSAPYWWPSQPKSTLNPSGCPWVQRDGKRYPAAGALSDDADRAAAFSAIYKLTLAWYYTGKPQYALRAGTDLRAWFLNSATAMNPNLNFAQLIPCEKDIRGIGIIDFSESLPNVIDAVALLDGGAPSWSASDHTGMKTWFAQFLGWLQSSPNGQDEKSAKNNHGSFFDQMEASLALSTGQPDLARTIVQAATATRLNVQISADGSQPLELARTLSWHYSMFNLMALTRLADVGRHVGVDLWSQIKPSDGSLTKAVDFLIPAASKTVNWKYPDSEFEPYQMLDVIHAAADAGDPRAIAALGLVPIPPRDGDIWLLSPTADLLH